ncbi:TetR/AcrR family transcriptional regulator [Providencia rettgeri]|uniref:TetR/AcrR family transcriptional regulator n=1 Tax=Providencia rettgeri TaxID=587 RepID=A0AAE2Z988_PRORE|nr:TetR/AcrR family transcriptional regulator [Providencia rettgeri]MBW3115031.1 TetR/AcrR family transcriptional regulator [Providencia rettgeri]NHN50566.1 TetR/AcrR family transcriptional regulator [Providencia rettgeri]
MARPLSEEKRQAILQATIKLFAEEGINASTSKIAKLAKVSEGSIFTYFSNKDELMNQLYLELKNELQATLTEMPEIDSLKESIWFAWKSYVFWGVDHPEKHQVLAKLAMSSNVSNATKELANETFCDVSYLLEKAKKQGALKDQSVEFIGALLGAMGDVTMSFVRKNPSASETLCKDGFTAFWNAITRT